MEAKGKERFKKVYYKKRACLEYDDSKQALEGNRLVVIKK